MSFIIYQATNKVNGKVYIGQTKLGLKHRKRVHLKKALGLDPRYTSNKFYNALRKYGPHNFEWEVLKETNEQEVDYWERYYIEKTNSVMNGYNLESGGSENKSVSKETKIKMSLAKEGNIPWNKGKQNHYPAWNKGKQNSYNSGENHYLSKGVICVETNQEYSTISECAEHMGLSKYHISKVCRGQRKSHGGYTFKTVPQESTHLQNGKISGNITR